MALPTTIEQQSLEFTVNGAPYVNVAGNSTMAVDGIHFVINGHPYYATSPVSVVTYNATQFFMVF